MDLKTLFTIIHLLGIAIGVGGAFASDLIFLTSIRDKKITFTEFRFISVGSKMVWTGLAILVLSGIGLFALDPSRLLISPKFQAKITIISLIVVNGIIFHVLHIPKIKRHRNEHLPSSDEFVRNRALISAGGAISMVSWLSALILGGWRNFPFSYSQTMLFYTAVVVIAILISYFVRHHILPHHKI